MARAPRGERSRSDHFAGFRAEHGPSSTRWPSARKDSRVAGNEIALDQTSPFPARPGLEGGHVRPDPRRCKGARRYRPVRGAAARRARRTGSDGPRATASPRSEVHTSELPSLIRISFAVFCLYNKHSLALLLLHLSSIFLITLLYLYFL